MEIKLNKKDNIKNISSQECFKKLSIEVHSHLIDVRTKPEWIYIGVPDLSLINKKHLTYLKDIKNIENLIQKKKNTLMYCAEALH